MSIVCIRNIHTKPETLFSRNNGLFILYDIVLGMSKEYSTQPWRRRRVVLVFLLVLTITAHTVMGHIDYLLRNAPDIPQDVLARRIENDDSLVLANEAINRLEIKPGSSSVDYSRDKFDTGWDNVFGCDMRNRILRRDLVEVKTGENGCRVLSGVLEKGPFTGEKMLFERGTDSSGEIHLEHVVAVSDAWSKGASGLTTEERKAFYNDPLNLIAVDGAANLEKGGSDASEWLPRKGYECRYVARQIAVKLKYDLWLAKNEYNAMKRVLETCPLQILPVEARQS